MEKDSVFYLGVDASKAKHAIAIAAGGRDGEVRYFSEIEATPPAVERFVRKLEKKHGHLHFCYEAGSRQSLPTGGNGGSPGVEKAFWMSKKSSSSEWD
jgi:hypothetical protein